MGDERRPEKQQVIDALVAAFASSRAAKLVGTDALRSVITVEYHDIVRDGIFDLQPVWELLEGQPGFEAEAVTAPLCVFKSWEDKLGLEVRLPAALAGRSDKEVALAAASCRVPPAEVKRLFPQREEPARPKADPAAASRSGTRRARKQRPRWMGAVAGVVATLAFAYVGLVLYQDCHPGAAQWQMASGAEVAKYLPGAGKAQQLGNQLQVTMNDAGWFRGSEDDRRQQLRDAFNAVTDHGVRVLIVRDGGGTARATVQRGRDGEVHVWLAN